MTTTIIVVLLLIVVLGVAVAAMYNGLVTRRNRVDNSWARSTCSSSAATT